MRSQRTLARHQTPAQQSPAHSLSGSVSLGLPSLSWCGGYMEQPVLAPSVRSAVFVHYERAVPLIVANFPLAPFTPVAYPRGLDQDAHYAAVRAWLQEGAETAVDRNGELLTTDPHDQKTQRVHVNVGSNAVGRYSALPYTLLGTPNLDMVTPIAWRELDTVANGFSTAANSAERLARGDVFGEASSTLVDQCFGDGPR